MKIRKLFQRAAAFALAAVTALSAVPATTAFAAGDIGTISFTHTYDGAGNAIRYNSSANIGGHTAGGTGKYKYRMFVDGETAFCLQPGVPLKTGNTLAKASSNAWNALSAEQKRAVGLVILDIMLAKMSGLNVLKQIRKSSSIPVIMLTAMDDTDTQIMSFDGLADDYVIKPFSIVLLGKRVTALLRRVGKTEPEKIWQQGDVMVDFSGFSAEKAGISVDISPKEVLLLKMLVEHPGVVLTREQILNYIWGIDIPLMIEQLTLT